MYSRRLCGRNEENALIRYVSISMADHGVLTFNLGLDLGAGFCCFGGYVIGHGYLNTKEFDATDKGLTAMMKIMDVVGVEKWEDLEGKYCRVKSDGWGSSIKIKEQIEEEKSYAHADYNGYKNDVLKFDTYYIDGDYPLPKNYFGEGMERAEDIINKHLLEDIRYEEST